MIHPFTLSPFICAARSLCVATPNVTLGAHHCCKCKRVAHGTLCITPLEDASLADIKHCFQECPSVGMHKEVCLLCIQEARRNLSPAAAAPPAAAAEQPIELMDSSDDESPSALTSDASNKTPPSKKPAMWLHAAAGRSRKKAEEKQKVHKKATATKSNTKKGRAGKEIEQTNEEKLEIVKEYEKLPNKGGFKAAYAEKIGVTSRTINRWRSSRGDLEKAVEDGRAKKKTVYKGDGLKRVKLGLKTFYAENERMSKAHKLPISGK